MLIVDANFPRVRTVNHRTTTGSQEVEFVIGESPFGKILVARSAAGLCAVLLGDDPVALRGELTERFPRASIRGGGEAARALLRQVRSLTVCPGNPIDAELDTGGTDFQRSVWRALTEIPVGETATYTEIASRIGRPKAVRAVGQACAANRLALVIPCHRALRSDGGLSGYRWGVNRKRDLLAFEGAVRAV